ncbi:MAG: pyridoxamine 5'-phosphate oxidase family protein [bacterium]|nr:pyridoxamine 5'-phosphate oxidase family protein [bacterium]
MNTKQKIMAFLDSEVHMSISTADKQGKVEAACVGFAHTSDGVLMFGTYNTSRKYQNLVNNPFVAVVIGFDEGISIQYEGIASQLAGDELMKLKPIYFSKHPTARKYEHDEPQVYFQIKPSWIRWIDTTKEVEEIEELHF